MAKCFKCGKEINFIKRTDKRSLVVNKKPAYFLLDPNGTQYFIHDGILKKGTESPDGLMGYKFHNCE